MKLRISYRFVAERVRWSWHDVQFGLDGGLLDPGAPKEFALARLGDDERNAANLYALAVASDTRMMPYLVERLAATETAEPSDQTKAKWLYLVLAWIYENKDSDPDPLQRVEEVYADFGYPAQIEGFVRYMPRDGVNPEHQGRGEQWLLDQWKEYLDNCAVMYGNANAP